MTSTHQWRPSRTAGGSKAVTLMRPKNLALIVEAA